MKFKFESLRIWQKAMDLGEDMNSLAYTFPKEEIYIFHLKLEEQQILLH